MRLSFAAAVALLVLALAACMGDEPASAPVETTPPLARLRIIFPEGFTRREMADRVAAVREIAIDERGVTPRLTKTGYLAASGAAVPPAEFRKDWKLSSIEGFLFPATYEFTKLTSSVRLVRDQVRAFRRSWRKVDLRYARSKNLTPYDVLIIASMIEKETVVPRERRLVAAVGPDWSGGASGLLESRTSPVPDRPRTRPLTTVCYDERAGTTSAWTVPPDTFDHASRYAATCAA